MKKLLFIFILALAANTSMAGIVISGCKVNASGGISINILDNSKSLTVSNTGKLTLDGFLTVNSAIENNGTIVLKTGSSLLNEGAVTGTGTFQVEQSIADNLVHYLSPTVGLANTSVFNGGFVSLYNEPQNRWDALGNNIPLEVGRGYALQYLSLQTIAFNGVVNTGIINLTCTNSGGGWNLIGNPYPSAIDWNAPGWTKPNIDNTIYFWNGVNYSYYVGSSGTLPPQSNLYVNNGTNIIPSRQGFFVKCTSNGQVGMTNEVRIHDNASPFYKESPETSNFRFVKILASGNGFQDEMMIGFDVSSTRFFDSDWDAFKLYTTHLGVPQIASIIPETEEQLAINILPELEKDMIVPLVFKSDFANDYSLSISDINLSGSLLIEDLKSGESRPLMQGSSYVFSYTAPRLERRFNLRFKEGQTMINEPVDGMFVVSAANGEIEILIPGCDNASSLNISVYDVMGRLMYERVFSGSDKSIKIPVNGFPAGVYVVKVVIGGQQTFTGKVTL